MARTYLEVENIFHNYEGYSPEKVREELMKKRKNPEEISEEERLFEKYKDEFCVLYRIKNNAAVDDDAGEKLNIAFEEMPYTPSEIESEKAETTAPETQLALECAFEDGTRFALSAMEATPKTADVDEPRQMKGQIHIPEDTLKALNDEKFKRIIEFCDRYGFSIFSLNVPMYGGEIDVDEKLAELLKKYQEEHTAEIENKGLPVISEDENDTTGMEPKDFTALTDDTPEIENEKSQRDNKPKMTLNEMVNNMRLFLENDMQKRAGLSYFEHVRTVNGRRTYVFSIYDTENRDNYRKDGRKKGEDGEYVTTASCRLMVSQDSSGKFYFGYCTPPGVPMKDAIACDFVNEIAKTGITHLNFSGVPNSEKITWLKACAEKGIVPTGLSFSKSKIETMFQSAEKKLSTEEYAIYIEKLMKQWEKNVAEKGQTLAISDQEFIKGCRNMAKKKREDQYDLLKKAEFEGKFKNFRDAYNPADGLLAKVNSLVMEGGVDTKGGAATSIAAMTTLARTCDIVLGLETDKTKALDALLGERLDELMSNPMQDHKGRSIAPRITEEEKRALAPLAGKKIKDLGKEDYMMIYNLLYTRQVKQTERAIVNVIKDNLKSGTKVAGHLLTDQLLWKAADTAVKQINEPLRRMGTDLLTLPDKHSGLHVSEFREMAEKELAEEKAREDAAKVMPVKASAERGR